MNQQLITESARDFVFELIKNELADGYTFHTFSHTTEVVEVALTLGKNSNLSTEDLELVELAAWFHDIGYINGAENHEESSAEIAEQFLTEHKYDSAKVELIKQCILATSLNSKPVHIIERIMADADLAHLGSNEQHVKSELLRQEIANVCDKKYNDEEWLEQDISFMLSHTFLTLAAQKQFHRQKVENLLSAQQKLQKIKERKKRKKTKKENQKLKREILELKNAKYRISDRGVQTMFRVTLKNHIHLSAIADNKANIMLSINAIIISILMTGYIARMPNEFSLFTIPVVIMLATSIATILLAVKSTRPKITSGKFTRQDIENKTANLLFFGNFHKMKLQDFEKGFNAMINDQDFLYDSLTRDFYYLGQVLGKKYNYLNKCYMVFSVGLTLAIASMLVSIFAYYN